jgi:hypothetical protein
MARVILSVSETICFYLSGNTVKIARGEPTGGVYSHIVAEAFRDFDRVLSVANAELQWCIPPSFCCLYKWKLCQ